MFIVCKDSNFLWKLFMFSEDFCHIFINFANKTIIKSYPFKINVLCRYYWQMPKSCLIGQLLTVAAERILKPWDSRRQGSGLGNALVRSLV